MYERNLQTFRTVLLIMGLILLIVFGARAASQADSMKLAGGRARHQIFAVTANPNLLGFLGQDVVTVPTSWIVKIADYPTKPSPTMVSSVKPVATGSVHAMPKTAINPVSGHALPAVSAAPDRLTQLANDGVPLGNPTHGNKSNGPK